MATSHEDLRDHLIAVLEAAPELPHDDREHLADVFLDELHAGYQLVPRAQHRSSRASAPSSGDLDTVWSALWQASRRWWPAIAAAFALLVVLPSFVWLVTAAFASSGHGHHPFGFLPFLFFLFLIRLLGPWRYRRRGRFWA